MVSYLLFCLCHSKTYELHYVIIINSEHFIKKLSILIGNLSDETEVLEWMMDQKNDNSIEEINRERLFEYIDSKEFLAVVFCKYYNEFIV